MNSKSKLSLFVCVVSLLTFSSNIAAQAKKSQKVSKLTKAASAQKDEEPKVLDFEADIIEGKRKQPELFLQMQTQDMTLDAILYLRSDFNDFHQVERNLRPGYFEKKTR